MVRRLQMNPPPRNSAPRPQGTTKADIPPYLGDEEGSGSDSDGENDPPAKQ